MHLKSKHNVIINKTNVTTLRTNLKRKSERSPIQPLEKKFRPTKPKIETSKTVDFEAVKVDTNNENDVFSFLSHLDAVPFFSKKGHKVLRCDKCDQVFEDSVEMEKHLVKCSS